MTDEISAEATGETVGEAKWAAVRELERKAPGIDRDAIRFQVVSEGERGLLGVGYSPAQVIAVAVPAEQPTEVPRDAEPGQPGQVRELLERVISSTGTPATVHIDSDAEGEVIADLAGDDLGVLIGRHGQTIDALQYLANAIGRRAFGEEARPVVVDAAGYRSRRAAALEASARATAERVAATGAPAALESMTAVERKVVHQFLQDDPQVETTSEGTEPNRYIVVIPVRSAD
jgi:spoIIIJ-associated protein